MHGRSRPSQDRLAFERQRDLRVERKRWVAAGKD
jgi:hypothetical protein